VSLELYGSSFNKKENMIQPKFIYQVDAFTAEPFKGNPAGVCILDHEPPVIWMQNVAMEMNLSETAFVFPGKDCREIRFYTPSCEVPLCGHATLSASHIMYETNIVKTDEETSVLSKAGELKVRKSGSWITVNFPAYPVINIPVPLEIEQIIGVKPLEFYKSAFGWTLALIDNEQTILDIKPDFRLMKNLKSPILISVSDVLLPHQVLMKIR